MKNAENKLENKKNLTDQIFELERQLDQMQAFIQQNEPHSGESLDLKNKVEHFKKKIKRITIELLQLRLKHREEENKL